MFASRDHVDEQRDDERQQQAALHLRCTNTLGRAIAAHINSDVCIDLTARVDSPWSSKSRQSNISTMACRMPLIWLIASSRSCIGAAQTQHHSGGPGTPREFLSCCAAPEGVRQLDAYFVRYRPWTAPFALQRDV
uniref:Uncharacterized protein n=1 Tax=Plectus sambesii TaxID=2011161 RepID=A0A914UVP8_9BILA